MTTVSIARSRFAGRRLLAWASAAASAIRTLRSSALFFCTALLLSSLLPLQGRSQDLSQTLNVSCGDKFVAKDVKGSVLMSPGNGSRAYSEVLVRASSGNCTNSSRLFVQSPSSGKQYNLVFLQEPTEMQRGNGIRIVDWSRDGRLLLFEVIL